MIPMRIPCPECGELHIDEGEFATKPHHTHACQHCGAVWRPAIEHTVGVRFLPGFKNETEPPSDHDYWEGYVHPGDTVTLTDEDIQAIRHEREQRAIRERQRRNATEQRLRAEALQESDRRARVVRANRDAARESAKQRVDTYEPGKAQRILDEAAKRSAERAQAKLDLQRAYAVSEPGKPHRWLVDQDESWCLACMDHLANYYGPREGPCPKYDSYGSPAITPTSTGIVPKVSPELVLNGALTPPGKAIEAYPKQAKIERQIKTYQERHCTCGGNSDPVYGMQHAADCDMVKP